MLAYKGKHSYDIIIVDDGSDNEDILEILNSLKEHQLIKIIHQQNLGPSVARNTAAIHSKSEFLLCLDSDNTIKTEYIDMGIQALKKNAAAAVFYGEPEFEICSDNRVFKAGPFNIEKLLVENYIDMCAVIRRKVWEDSRGLEECLWQFEDWEFWIRIYKAGWQFVYTDKKLFKYRIREGSLVTQAGKDGYKKMIAFIYQKHWDLVYAIFHRLYAKGLIYNEDMKKPLRSLIKYSKKKYFG